MQRSRRGQVDPFIVMDVMEAARKAEAVGPADRPSRGRPALDPGAGRRAGGAGKARWRRDALGYTVTLGIPELSAGHR